MRKVASERDDMILQNHCLAMIVVATLRVCLVSGRNLGKWWEWIRFTPLKTNIEPEKIVICRRFFFSKRVFVQIPLVVFGGCDISMGFVGPTSSFTHFFSFKRLAEAEGPWYLDDDSRWDFCANKHLEFLGMHLIFVGFWGIHYPKIYYGYLLGGYFWKMNAPETQFKAHDFSVNNWIYTSPWPHEQRKTRLHVLLKVSMAV